MTTFTIDCDNNITAFASLKEAKAADIAGAEYFDSQKELAKLADSWSVAGTRGRGSSKLMELWNSLPGVAPVKKFTDRKTALAGIWKAAQALTPPSAPQGATDAQKGKGSKKKATRRKKPPRARRGSRGIPTSHATEVAVYSFAQLLVTGARSLSPKTARGS